MAGVSASGLSQELQSQPVPTGPWGGGTRGRLHGADLRLELPGKLLSVCLVLVVVKLPTLTLHSVNHRLLLPSLLLTPHMQ